MVSTVSLGVFTVISISMERDCLRNQSAPWKEERTPASSYFYTRDEELIPPGLWNDPSEQGIFGIQG